ncbi:MAG: hypothetical protein ACYC9L_04035 [Sulfuricaulis sp.]
MTSKRLCQHIIFLSALLIVTDAIADNSPITPIGHIGIDYAVSMKYHEPSMSESGRPYGIYLDWDILPMRRWTILGNFSAMVGHLNYNGQTQSGIPLKSTTSDDIFMGELALGFHLGATNDRTLYAGIGERYWKDFIANSTAVNGTPAFGYHRDVTYLYVPVGMRLDSALGQHWRLEIDAKYMSLLHGRVNSHLEDVNPNLNTLRNTQNQGHGYAIGVRFAHRLANNPTFTGYFIEPYYQAWSVKRTDNTTAFYYGIPDGYGYEPDNATHILGLRFGLSY